MTIKLSDISAEAEAGWEELWSNSFTQRSRTFLSWFCLQCIYL